MLKRREMMPSDFVKINAVDSKINDELRGQNLMVVARAHIARGPCATIECDGKILACGGIHIRWPGCAEAWVRFSLPTGPLVAMGVRDILRGWMESENLNRVDAHTLVDWKEGRKFLEWMGMSFECIMKRFGPQGEDRALYAWVRK
jgi:hypothetical protein